MSATDLAALVVVATADSVILWRLWWLSRKLDNWLRDHPEPIGRARRPAR